MVRDVRQRVHMKPQLTPVEHLQQASDTAADAKGAGFENALKYDGLNVLQALEYFGRHQVVYVLGTLPCQMRREMIIGRESQMMRVHPQQ